MIHAKHNSVACRQRNTKYQIVTSLQPSLLPYPLALHPRLLQPPQSEHIERAPVITGPSPVHSYAVFRNASIALPILGAAPAAPSLAAAPGGALFRDPDGDPLLVRIVAPP